MRISKSPWLIASGVVGLATAILTSSNLGCLPADHGTTNASSGSGGSNNNGSGGSNNNNGSGGSNNNNGSGGSNNNNGSGGSGPTDAGSTASFAYTFDTGMQGFAFNSYVPTNGTTNLAAAEAGSLPTLTFDSSSGHPDPGSLKMGVTFTDFKQSVDVIISPSPALSLMGKTIHAQVKVNAGTFPPGMGATLHAGTGSTYAYGAGAYTSLKTGDWTDLSLDLSTPTSTGWDPTMVVQIGIQFYSGDPADGGAFAGPVTLDVSIDSITDGTGTGTVTPPTTNGYTFDTGLQGFSFNVYTPTNGTINLAAAEAGTLPTLTFDSGAGSPNPGSLKATVSFTDYKQFVDVIVGPNPALDLTGKTLHAQVQLTNGTLPAGAGVTLHAGSTSSYIYGGGSYTTPMPTGWTDVSMDVGSITATGWDPTMIVQVGLQFYSGDPPEAGGAFTAADLTFNIDSITY